MKGEMFKFNLYQVITPEKSSLIAVTADGFSLRISPSPPHASTDPRVETLRIPALPFLTSKAPVEHHDHSLLPITRYHATQVLKTAHIW